MPNDQMAVYWDANVFLAYINGNPERLPHIDAYLEKSGKEVQIYTSTVSIVEVAFGKSEQDGKCLDEDTEKRINSLWMPGSPVRIVEFHSIIADVSKKLMRDSITKGWSLKSMDAIHIATAQTIPVNEIHTYDSGLIKYGEIIGIRIGPPIASQPKLL
jgi:predicted nucleic acid-binding protein